MFPAIPSKLDDELESLITKLISDSASLGSGLNPKIINAIGEFMFSINSYYTNAMEGNPSKLKDIENALNQKLADDKALRNFQLEHLAHIATQKEMLERLKNEDDLKICSKDFLCWLHKEFYLRLPKEMHFAQTYDGKRVSVLPGQLRDRPAGVGAHTPPETLSEIEQCLGMFEKSYSFENISGAKKFLAFASSHHRLLWIHPFRDGNGRVARLFTIAYEFKLGINLNCLWTVTRAFARNRSEYDKHLTLADRPKRNDYDGRGPLSEEDLTLFCKYFLRECLDQLAFMNSNLELHNFENKYVGYLKMKVGDKTISKNAAKIMRELFFKGEIFRGDVQDICDVRRRRATEIIKELLNCRLVKSPSPHGNLRLHLTSEMGTFLFPELV